MKFEESEQDRYGIRKGDLIMCEGGEPGRCAIWNANVPNMKIQKALHRIRVNNMVFNKFVYCLFTLYAQNGYLEKYFTGTTIKHLTGQSLKSIEIPLPPLTEQQRIVKEIESRLSQATATETYIENALQQAEALRQSILKKAFSGELV
jgi:type I restriction enzyme S subunit